MASLTSPPGPSCFRIGVVSDTHGWLRPEVLRALRGVDLVMHAGDIGDPDILRELEAVAPVRAVRGNMDCGAWARELPEQLEIETDHGTIVMVHDADRLNGRSGQRRIVAVIAGHTHVAEQEDREGTLFFNPGSAGPSRKGLPVSVGLIEIRNGRVQGEIVFLEA